jgi:hypothetical protein
MCCSISSALFLLDDDSIFSSGVKVGSSYFKWNSGSSIFGFISFKSSFSSNLPNFFSLTSSLFYLNTLISSIGVESTLNSVELDGIPAKSRIS